jgi:hypothetical protein
MTNDLSRLYTLGLFPCACLTDPPLTDPLITDSHEPPLPQPFP